MKKHTLLFALVILAFNCVEEKKETPMTLKYVEESHSNAKPNEAVIKHLDLDIVVDFEHSIIDGSATYTIESTAASEIILWSS